MLIRDIVSKVVSDGGITIRRVDAVDLAEYRGPGIAVGLDNDTVVVGADRVAMAKAIAEHALSGNISGWIGYWLERPNDQPSILHRDRVVVLPDRSWAQVSYAVALAVQYRQLSVWHWGTSQVIFLQDARNVSARMRPRPDRPCIAWYDTMAIGAESLIAIHADTWLSFGSPGSRPDFSCALFHGVHGEVSPVPLDDVAFTSWWNESTASLYFKHRASDRQSQTRRIACRKLGV